MIFIFCLNLAIGIICTLQFPGSASISPLGGNVTAEEYEAQFNSTAIAGGWTSTPFSGIPLIGDIFAGFNFLWQNLQYLIDGFPTVLTWIRDSFITDANGRFAFDVIATALRALYALLISIFLIEYIGGRIISD